MKRLVVALVAVVMVSLVGGSFVFAQNRGRTIESDLIYINVPLERIWPHRLGYVVQYRASGNRFVRAYLPIEWFGTGDGRAEIMTLPLGPSWPSMSVFFRGGEFSHVRVYVHRSPMHQTWGYMPMTVNLDSQFEGVETLELQF